MADRTPLLLAKEEDGQALQADEQLMEFVVSSFQTDDKGNRFETPKIPLFRIRASVSQIEAGKLSGFWEDCRRSMYHAFDTPKDVEAARKGIDKVNLRAVRTTEGESNEKLHTYAKTLVTATPNHYPYKARDMKGSFCFDPDLKETTPIKDVNIAVFLYALKNQLHEESMGDPSAGKPKYLWSPLEEGDEDADPTIATYIKNFDQFKTWAGRIVNWEFVEYTPAAKR